MPLPLILIGIAALTGLLGAGKGIEAAAQISKVTTALNGIEKVCKQNFLFVTKLSNKMTPILNDLSEFILEKGNDYKKYNKKQRSLVHLSVEYANLLKSVLETPLLTKDGTLKQGIGKKLDNFSSIHTNFLGYIIEIS